MSLCRSAIACAARDANVRILDALVRHGADLNSALHDAVKEGGSDAARRIDRLLQAGVSVEGRDKLGRTPLHTAAERRNLRAAVALRKHGAVIDARDNIGQTPLHLLAADIGDYWKFASAAAEEEMVDFLLRRGADETATDILGETPADLASKCCGFAKEGNMRRLERVRKLLENAPVAREAWRRRGLLVASRARPEMVTLTTRARSRGAWMDLMGRVLALGEEGVFRTIVGYI